MSEAAGPVSDALQRAGEVLEAPLESVRRAAAKAFGRATPTEWWHVGHVSAPYDFVPREHCSWANRFDDPHHEYRTVYLADKPITCLREVLADLRPNTAVRSDFRRFQLAQGIADDDQHVPSRRVTREWREENVLVEGYVERDGPYADIDDARLRAQLEQAHFELLAAHGMDHLDVSQLRSKDREVRQTIGRDIFDHEAAGILYESGLDSGRCLALFEHRASFAPTRASPVDLTDDVADLRTVCDEFRLLLDDA